MSSLAFGREQRPSPCARVDGLWFDDNPSVLDQLADICARVGVADFVLLRRVEPDLALANARDGGGEALLRAEIDHLDFGRISPSASTPSLPTKLTLDGAEDDG